MALEIRPALPAAPVPEAVRVERAPEPAPREPDARAVAEQLTRETEAQLERADKQRAQRHREAAGDNAIRQTRLDISVTDDGELLVKVRDARTDKVVRTIPPDELVEFGRKMKQYIGLILDRRG